MTRHHNTVAVTRLRLSDLISEATAALVARPARSILTALGTLLGVATLVVIIGLTSTASGRISEHFDALAATTVIGHDQRTDTDQPTPLSDEAVTRVANLNGVEGAGVTWTISTDDKVTSSNPAFPDPQALPLVAASPSLWDAINPTLAAGRTYDAFHNHLPVTVLGRGVAASLGITGQASNTTILIGSRPFTVAGVLENVDRRPDLLLAVIIPTGTAQDLWGAPPPGDNSALVVATRPGAAVQVADELSLAASPTAPRNVSVEQPPDPRNLRESVSSDLTGLFYALAAICLFIGTVGITNTTLVAVMERTAEIGLRRTLGARRRHIAAHVMAESATLGTIGGILGATIGLFLVIAISIARDWTPLINPGLLLAAPLIGLTTGAIAGLHPALRAARIEPSEALRR